MNRSLARGLVLAAALFVIASAAPAAEASRWPSPRVTYRDASGIRGGFPGLADTIRAWNAATTRVRLVPARRGARAQITIMAKDTPWDPLHPWGAYPPDGRIWMGSGWRSHKGGPDPSHAPNTFLAHEIGHTLGLRHSRNPCDLMYPTNPLKGGGFPGIPVCRRSQLPTDLFPCGPQKADARALVRLYGGRVRSRRHFGLCSVPPDPQRPDGTLAEPAGEVSIDAYSDTVHIRVRNDSSTTWTGGVYLQFVSATGTAEPYADCDPRSPAPGPARAGAADSSSSDAVQALPGQDAAFEFLACRPPSPDFGETPQPDTRSVFVRMRTGARLGPIFQINLRWVTRPPVAAFTFEPTDPSVAAGTSALAFVDRSSDPDSTNRITAWAWDFGDPDSGDNSASYSNPSHQYNAPGTYHVTLTVTDDEGQTSSTAQDVTVSP